MRRRTIISGLATGGAIALAGCANRGCTSGTSVRFEPVDAAAIASQATSDADGSREMVSDLLTHTLEGDEPTVETIHRTPLGWLTYVERNDAFYGIGEETVAEGRVSGPEYELSRDRETDDDVSSSNAVSFANLPRHDRWRLNETADFNVENVDRMRFSIPFVAGYLEPDEQAASRLAAGVDEPFLAVDGSYAELERTGEGTATARRVRYTAERVAASIDEFADRVLERRGAELTDPSDEIRSLLEDARANDGRLEVCDHEIDDVDEETADERRAAVDRLAARLDRLETGSGHDDPLEYVAYEGRWYRLSLSGHVV